MINILVDHLRASPHKSVWGYLLSVGFLEEVFVGFDKLVNPTDVWGLRWRGVWGDMINIQCDLIMSKSQDGERVLG